MKFLPVVLNISGKKILIAGGGKAAFQKIKVLRKFIKAENIKVVAPDILRGIKNSGCRYEGKRFSPADLNGVFLVYACTDDGRINAGIRREAHKRGILVNAVDDPEKCDFISPAIYKKGFMSVAVSSNGRNVKKTLEWRNRLKGIFEKND